jgi:hypothetical protein
LAKQDIDNAARRQVIDFLIKRALEYNRKKYNFEILTVDNHADGIYIYNYLKKKNPAAAKAVLKLLKFHGGCSAGSKIVDVSPKGEVYACQFWQQQGLGNIRERDFNDIWLDKDDPELCRLRSKAEHLKGNAAAAVISRIAAGAGSGRRL